MELLSAPLGVIMYYCYSLVKNYGLALLLFTLLTKLVMIPFAISQQKNTVKMVMLRPRMEEIQKKYKNDPTKINEEINALYQKENYNMMSGCLPLFIQFPILLGLVNVIYNPLKHILRIPAEIRTSAIEIVTTSFPNLLNKYSNEISVIAAYRQNPSAFAALGGEFAEKVSNFDFTFLGMDMGTVPTFSFANPQAMILMLIPLLSAVSAFLMMYLSMKSNPAMTEGGAAGASWINLLIMPVMSFWIALRVPAGVGIYWLLSNLYSIVQQRILNRVYNPKEVAERIKREMEEEKERERQEKKEAKLRVKAQGDSAAQEDKEKALSQKEINRRKLAEARRRDAEKYGEEYVEVTDTDVE